MSDFELRRKLAQLPRELAPQRDLWPAVSARIAPRRASQRKHARWLAPFALAASAALVAVLALGPDALQEADLGRNADHHPMVMQADALAAEYDGAMRALGPIAFPPELTPVVEDLDRSLTTLHQALQADPSAGFLLDQLRRTYSQRLRLSQRAITEWTWVEPGRNHQFFPEQPHA